MAAAPDIFKTAADIRAYVKIFTRYDISTAAKTKKQV